MIKVYTCGKPFPLDLKDVFERWFPSVQGYYINAVRWALADDPTAPSAVAPVVVFSKECPKGEGYAFFVLDVLGDDGKCRRIVLAPEVPNFIEEYGPCPSGVKPPDAASIPALRLSCALGTPLFKPSACGGAVHNPPAGGLRSLRPPAAVGRLAEAANLLHVGASCQRN